MKFFYLSVLLSCFFLKLSAQDWSNYSYGNKYPGYVITAKGTKIGGYIMFTNRYELEKNVIFYKDKNNRKSKEKYKAEDLKEYKMGDMVYRVIHYSGGLMKKPVRGNLLLKDGCISEYVWYNKAEYADQMKKGPNESEKDFMKRKYPSLLIFKKKGDEYPKPETYFGISYKKKMSEYISDQPKLAQKVSDGEKGYGMLHILDVFAEYNENCKQ